PMAAGNLTNTVSVSGADFDPVTANNTVSATTLVLSPPFITAPPQSQSVTNGGVASIRVTATGTAPLAYQWFADGSLLAGATNFTLTISNVPLSAAGSYTVRITNLVGSVTSAPAVLTVLVSPAFVTQPQSLTNLA